MTFSQFLIHYRFCTTCPRNVSPGRWAAMVRSYHKLLIQIDAEPILSDLLA